MIPLIFGGIGIFLLFYSSFNVLGLFLIAYGIILSSSPYMDTKPIWAIIVLGIAYTLSLGYIYYDQSPKQGKSWLIRLLYGTTGIYGLYLITTAHWSYSKTDAFYGALLLFYALFVAHVPFSFKPPIPTTLLWMMSGVVVTVIGTIYHFSTIQKPNK